MDARTAPGWPTRELGRSLLAESRRLRRAHRVAGAPVGRVRVVARRRDLVDAITAVVVAGVARERALAGRHGEPIDAVALRDVEGDRMILPQDMEARVTVELALVAVDDLTAAVNLRSVAAVAQQDVPGDGVPDPADLQARGAVGLAAGETHRVGVHRPWSAGLEDDARPAVQAQHGPGDDRVRGQEVDARAIILAHLQARQRRALGREPDALAVGEDLQNREGRIAGGRPRRGGHAEPEIGDPAVRDGDVLASHDDAHIRMVLAVTGDRAPAEIEGHAVGHDEAVARADGGGDGVAATHERPVSRDGVAATTRGRAAVGRQGRSPRAGCHDGDRPEHRNHEDGRQMDKAHGNLQSIRCDKFITPVRLWTSSPAPRKAGAYNAFHTMPVFSPGDPADGYISAAWERCSLA